MLGGDVGESCVVALDAQMMKLDEEHVVALEAVLGLVLEVVDRRALHVAAIGELLWGVVAEDDILDHLLLSGREAPNGTLADLPDLMVLAIAPRDAGKPAIHRHPWKGAALRRIGSHTLALAGLEDAEAPAMRDRTGLWKWRRSFDLRTVYETVEVFYHQGAVRRACTAAVGRLPRVQAEMINDLFFQNQDAAQLALARNCSRSTIYNNSAKAKKNMENDDCFYIALFQLGILRDQTRAAEIPRAIRAGGCPTAAGSS